MIYDKLTTPCAQCPFLESMAHGFSLARLEEFASGAFHCHQTGERCAETGNYVASKNSHACAGALIYLEKQGRSSNFMRIMERLGAYHRELLDMSAPVRE